MACFLAPAVAAVVTTVIRKKVSPKYHFDWLLAMLWGGTVMLIVDHIASREIVPYYPFLTAGWSSIRREILTVGVTMTIAVVAVWAVMVYVSRRVDEKKTVIENM